jgi:hypothetical protein
MNPMIPSSEMMKENWPHSTSVSWRTTMTVPTQPRAATT